MRGPVEHWTGYIYRIAAAELSAALRYYDRVVQVAPLPFDNGFLLDRIECRAKDTVATPSRVPDLGHEADRRTALLLNGNCNHTDDIQGLLGALRAKMARTSRVFLVAYNPYLAWLYKLASRVGLRGAAAPTTFLTRTTLDALARLAGFEVVRIRPAVYSPLRLLGVGSALNRLLPALPVVRWLGFVSIVVLRPAAVPVARPSLGIVIPARNERGNIAAAIERIPVLPGVRTKIVFVEGHSTDGTWEEIERVRELWSGRRDIVALRQTGTGKYDAVRAGFRAADTDVLVVLDADLTMPPEVLPRFYDAYCSGAADFVNGSRQVYPMEGEAMRTLNRFGNAFFARALSYVLSQPVSDALCGTKLLARHDWLRIEAWREDFGDFDPFGDFDLLFAAAVLGIGAIDLPIGYRKRTYGSTQIHRFRHGWQLARMTAIGWCAVRLGRLPARVSSRAL